MRDLISKLDAIGHSAKQTLTESAVTADTFEVGDAFGISFNSDYEIGTEIVGFLSDGIVIELDDTGLRHLTNEGLAFHEGMLVEDKVKKMTCWKGHKKTGLQPGTGKNAGKMVNDCEKIKEAEYQGRKVTLNKKMPGDVKKSKVYVRKPNGNIVKVNFGDKKMRIKKSNPARRKSFRARHNCKNPGPKWKARYWSCRSW